MAGCRYRCRWCRSPARPAGLAFGMLFGAVTTRRAGVVFALISLGVGELVFAAIAHAAGLLRRRGRHHRQPRRRAASRSASTFASQLQVYYVIAFWAIVAAALMYAFTAHAGGPHVQRGARQPRTRRIHRLRHAARALHRVLRRRRCSPGSPAACTRSTTRSSPPNAVSAARSGTVLLMVYIGGVNHFIGAILGAITITWLQVSLSDYTTAWQLYLGPLLHGHRAVRARRARRTHPDARADPAHARVLRRAARRTRSRRCPRWSMLVGAITLLEINYRLSTQPEAGARMTLFWIDMDTRRRGRGSPRCAAHRRRFLVFRRTWPLVARGLGARPGRTQARVTRSAPDERRR